MIPEPDLHSLIDQNGNGLAEKTPIVRSMFTLHSSMCLFYLSPWQQQAPRNITKQMELFLNQQTVA